MAKLTLKDWLYAQHVPPEVMVAIEKLFALPEDWDRCTLADCAHAPCSRQLRAILGIEQSKR
jgi:hypothetical protein